MLSCVARAFILCFLCKNKSAVFIFWAWLCHNLITGNHHKIDYFFGISKRTWHGTSSHFTRWRPNGSHNSFRAKYWISGMSTFKCAYYYILNIQLSIVYTHCNYASVFLRQHPQIWLRLLMKQQSSWRNKKNSYNYKKYNSKICDEHWRHFQNKNCVFYLWTNTIECLATDFWRVWCDSELMLECVANQTEVSPMVNSKQMIALCSLAKWGWLISGEWGVTHAIYTILYNFVHSSGIRLSLMYYTNYIQTFL